MPTSTSSTPALRGIFTPTAIARLVLGWGAFLALTLAAPLLAGPLSTPVVFGVLAAIVAVIIGCAFGVVTQAEHLARRLGDPYGTLVLTLSIVLIEVILISAVMLGPGEQATIARDSVTAVSMIILNLVIGVALVAGGWRGAGLRPNSTGVSAYLSILVVLITVALALPAAIGTGGVYTPGQAVPIIGLTVMLYSFFLLRQMGSQRTDFQEVGSQEPDFQGSRIQARGAEPALAVSGETGQRRHGIGEVFAVHRTEILLRAAVLVATVLPIVLLSHDMATLLDDGLSRAGAPTALSGLLIAMIVFLPETITTIRAATTGEMQRVSNLCHGALVSTVGLTIPAVLTIGLLTERTAVLAESPANLLLLGVSLLLTQATFSGKRVTALHGAAHLFVFVLYVLTMFQ